MNFFKKLFKKKFRDDCNQVLSVGDTVAFNWRNDIEFGIILNLKFDGAFIFPTPESVMLDEPLWNKCGMATVGRFNLSKDMWFTSPRFNTRNIHKLTIDELMLWKLENE